MHAGNIFNPNTRAGQLFRAMKRRRWMKPSDIDAAANTRNHTATISEVRQGVRAASGGKATVVKRPVVSTADTKLFEYALTGWSNKYRRSA
jgi:hypothetical protein